MGRLLHLIGTLSISLLLFSCEKTYGVETRFNAQIGAETTISVSVGQTDTIYREQAVLFDEMQARHQIYDVQCYKGVWSIRFKQGRIARFSENVFPFIQVGENRRWTLSGYPTDVPVEEDGNGNPLPPALYAAVDGPWFLGGMPTGLSTEAYQKFLLEEADPALNITGFLLYEDQLLIYLSDGSFRKCSIVREGFYLVPDYWMEFLVEKEKKAEDAIREMDGDGVAFAFFTDAHWGYNYKHSPALIRHITEYTPISNVFYGGDVVTNFFNNTVTPMQLGLDFQASFSFLGPHFYCVYGNHDDNSASQPSATERHLTEEMVISYLQSQMTELDKKEGYNFYFDDPATRTRYVGLDTGRYNNGTFRTTSTRTARFLIDALSDVPEGWHILVISHIWAEYKKVGDDEISAFTAYYNTYLQIIHDYNDRKAGTFTYKKESVDYDFSDGRAMVECCFGGHTHLNSVLFSKDVLPVIIAGKDSMKRPANKVYEGTVKEQCVLIIVVDYKHRKIHSIHVGYGPDQVIDLPIHSE